MISTLKLVNENGINIRQSKCVSRVQTMEYLGYTTSLEGITSIKEEVDTIRQYPILSYVTQLGSFLGMAKFCHRLFPVVND